MLRTDICVTLSSIFVRIRLEVKTLVVNVICEFSMKCLTLDFFNMNMVMLVYDAGILS